MWSKPMSCLQILPAKGPQHAVRGQALMTAIKQPELSLAAAATAASNAAGMHCQHSVPGSSNEQDAMGACYTAVSQL